MDYNDIIPMQANVLDNATTLDANDTSNILRTFLTSYKYNALIKSKGASTSVSSGGVNGSGNADEYTVDIYEDGYVDDDYSDLDPTRTGLPAHALHATDLFEVGERVQVHLLPDNTCWIVHDQPPIFGVVVCKGPNGEVDFSNNQYWMSFGFCDVTDNDDKSEMTVEAFDKASDFYKIVSVTNLAESNYKTHLIKQGAVCRLQYVYDLSSPVPKKLWFTEYVDNHFIGYPCLVKLNGNAGGGGKYVFDLWYAHPNICIGSGTAYNDVDPSTDLNDSDLGTAETKDLKPLTVYGMNVRESGQDTHDLDTGGDYLPQIFPATFWHINKDGTIWVVGDWKQHQNCTSTDTGSNPLP